MNLRQSGSGRLWVCSWIALEPDLTAVRLLGVVVDETDRCPFFSHLLPSPQHRYKSKKAVVRAFSSQPRLPGRQKRFSIKYLYTTGMIIIFVCLYPSVRQAPHGSIRLDHLRLWVQKATQLSEERKPASCFAWRRGSITGRRWRWKKGGKCKGIN